MTDSRSGILAKLKNRPTSEVKLPNIVLNNSSSLSVEELLSHFVARCRENRTEVHVLNEQSWCDKLAQLANEKELKHWLLGTDSQDSSLAKKTLTTLNAKITHFDTNFERLKDTLFDSVDAALTHAEAAIAETGTLVLIPSAHEPRTMSLIPPVHIVLLDRARLIYSFQEYIQSCPKQMPTNLLFISSPSKTADIQQTLAFGAHGPKELIVLVK